MSLIEAANLGFTEEEFTKFVEPAWRTAVFERGAGKDIVMINKGKWGLMEKMETSRELKGMTSSVSVSYKGNLVWEMQRRGTLGERFLREYDCARARTAVNFLKQIPLHLKLKDLYDCRDERGNLSATEVRIGGFKDLVYHLISGGGELGNFICDETILIELSRYKSDTLWTGGIQGGLVFP